MIEALVLVALLLLQVQESGGQQLALNKPPTNTWPLAKLIYPSDGLLIEGAGRAANITFDVSGDPFPEERKWYKDGEEITQFTNINIDESGGNIVSLKFNALAKMNEGVYYYIVRESKLTLEASKSEEVRLKVSFLDNFQSSSTQQVSANVGEYAVLRCNPPTHFGAYPKFSWRKEGVSILESDSIYISEFGDLVIMQVAMEHYSSDYRCTISIDSLMEGQQEKEGPAVSLIVRGNAASYVAPNIALGPVDRAVDAQVKRTFRVECAVNGYPTLPSIRWFKNSVQITSSGPIYDIQQRNYLQITIPRSSGDVSATYRCEASDGTKQAMSQATINIYTKPVLTTALPTAPVKKSSTSTLDLSCDATATPSPKFRWYKNAVELKSDDLNTYVSGGNLTINNINSLDKGVYQCEAYNDIGSAVSTGMIRVQERLSFVIRPADVDVYLGAAATFNCQGKGDPGPTSLRWEFNGATPPVSHKFSNRLVNQATYRIPEVTSAEKNGRVGCIISSPDNLYPTDTAVATLTIREGPQVKAFTKNITANEGEARDLTCIVENVISSVEWKWLQGETLIIRDDDGKISIKQNMLQVRSLTAADQGTYTCQAGENGITNSDTMFLMVRTSPRITMETEVRIGEGQDVRLTCSVTANPAPTITWSRNGQTLNNNAKYLIDTVTDHVSVLVVRNVRKTSDVGTYKCEASNLLNTRSAEVNLMVVAVCEVMDRPKDASVEFLSSTSISCTVNACPSAVWTWRKDGEIINFDNSRYIDRGSSIELRQVVPSDGGTFSCTVSSDQGQGTPRTAVITVIVPTTIYSFPQPTVLFLNGDRIELECSARGDNTLDQIMVSWFKSGNVIDTGPLVTQKDETEKIFYATANLVIENAIASDGGPYQCVASNSQGHVQRDTSLQLMNYPAAPGQPRSKWAGVGAVVLSWTEPSIPGNTPLTSYEIQIESKGNGIFRPFLTGLNPNEVYTTVYFLQENQEYNFKVMAVNVVGVGPPSIASVVIGTEKTKDKQVNLVESFTLSSVSSDSIKVTWSMPADRNTALTGYKIVYRNEEKQELPKFKVIDEFTMLETTLDDLDGGSLYSVQVQSIDGNEKIVVSTVKTVLTQNQEPSPPAECIADREASTRIVVSWNQPENPHGKILHYTIYYRRRGAVNDPKTVVNVTDPQSTSMAVPLDDASVDYEVEITASNSAGEGEPFQCLSSGKTIQVAWYSMWWFYLIIAIVGVIILIVIAIIVLTCYRARADRGPKMQKIPPPSAPKDDFRGPNAQVYSPNTARSYVPPPAGNPMNTFSGGAMGSPEQNRFGTATSDFRYGAQPKSPDYGYNPNKFNTFDSRASYNDPPKPSYSGFGPPSFYDPPKPSYEPPKTAYEPQSPKSGYGGGYGGGYNAYDQGSNYDNTSRYDNNTFDSRYRGDNTSRGYPTYDRNGGGYGGGGGGGNFKSSQL
ncbi:hypothetical protein ACHWQZ_G005388 [Mnemiopsis leidyi]